MATTSKAIFELQTLPDIADFLNISSKQLRFILYGRIRRDRYRVFSLAKRTGGVRTICAPRRELKFIQRSLACRLYDHYKPRHSVHGFCIGRSVASNAALHWRARYVFNVDLKDFFPSINFGRVRGLFLSAPFSLPAGAATVLAQICCHDNSLPQGAPTSPIVSNMICSRMDGELTRLAKMHRCWYSRYADDITFPKRKSDFPPEIGYATPASAQAGPELLAIIESNGFQINDAKVHLQSNHRRQRVTGLVVNAKVNVPRRFVRQVRAMIHACAAHGVEAASDRHANMYYRRTSRVREPPPIEAVIRGKLEFIKMVKGFNDPVYRNLQTQFVKVSHDYLRVMQRENSQMSERDLFISHASEDKVAIAKPLADGLLAAGITVWYDEYEVKLGDSLLQKINQGLANSRYGVVILSHSFFKKNWTRKELDGLTALENADGNPRVLPVWHGLSFQQVAHVSPILAGLKAADTSKHDIATIVEQIGEVLG